MSRCHVALSRCHVTLVSTAILFGSAVSMPSFAALELLDRIAVVVGKDVITMSALERRMNDIKQRAQAGGMSLPDEETLQSQIVDHLILEQLQLQMARRVGLLADDQQVNQAIGRMKASNKLDDEGFMRALASEGLTLESLRKRLRRELTIQQIQRALVSQRIQISDLEINNFLKSADAQFWVSPEFHIGHILIALPQAANNDDVKAAEAEATALYEKLNKGAKFADMAIAHSNGALALKGGDLGWRKTTDLPSLFAEIVPELEVGQVSKPARSGAGFHILKLYEKRGDENQVVRQSNVRHILVKPSAILSNEEAEAKLKKLRQEILDGADFAEVAKENSEDIGSMLQGGELGWSNPGQFVPAFEKAISEAEVGEISEPFRSRFGWHILQVTERRDEDMTEEVLRMKAQQVLTSRRFEDELQVWLRELKDEAFIEIKI